MMQSDWPTGGSDGLPVVYPPVEIPAEEVAARWPHLVQPPASPSDPYERWNGLERSRPGVKTVLHVGCGPANPLGLNRIFRTPEWREIRLDIDEGVKPDIIGTITDLTQVPSGAVDALWSSHNVEHIYAHEVPRAMSEFARVLKPGGILLITCPDLQAVATMIANGEIEKTVYTSRDGTRPITPLDMIYGWGIQIAEGRTYMAHRTGYTAMTLGKVIHAAGFPQVQVGRGKVHDLWALAIKDRPIEDRAMLQRAIA